MINVRPALLVALFTVIAVLSAHADGQKRLAVLEFEVAQGVKIDRTYFSDLARGAVKKQAPQLFVMTRESTEVLLQANGKTLADCTGECEVEIGRKLGADYIISGRITQIGTRQVLTLRLFSTADGALMADEEASGKSQDQLFDESKAAMGRLIKSLTAEVITPTAKVAPVEAALTEAAATNAAESQARPSVLHPGQTKIDPKSGLEFVAIPGGTFYFKGGMIVSLKAFSLGTTAVTVEAYARCVQAGPCAKAATAADHAGCNLGTDRTNHPMNCVDWNHATAFCKWIGGRMPTKEERAYVASGGTEGRLYPWGGRMGAGKMEDEPGARVCWSGQGNDSGKRGQATTCPVGSHSAGDSKWGIHDLAGNVWEWVSSHQYPSNEVLGGGSWNEYDPSHLWAQFFSMEADEPSLSPQSIGFRCAM